MVISHQGIWSIIFYQSIFPQNVIFIAHAECVIKLMSEFFVHNCLISIHVERPAGKHEQSMQLSCQKAVKEMAVKKVQNFCMAEC